MRIYVQAFNAPAALYGNPVSVEYLIGALT